MLIIDTILAAPGKALMSVFMEIYNAALQERDREAESLRGEISRLYLRLESGAISEAEFDLCEQELLDRLDAIERRTHELVAGTEQADEDRDDDELEYEESGDFGDDENAKNDEDRQQPASSRA